MLELANVYFVGITHFVNVLLLAFLARSGLEILASYPRLYLRDDCKPGTEWLALTRKKIPEGRLWTTLEQEADWSPWLALPGHRNLGLARLWHFLAMVLWIANGLVYYVLLFLSDEWRRLIPTSWSVFPDALHVAATYLRFELPPRGNPYNALQQLSYAAMAFLFPAFMLLTGFAMSPAVVARWPRVVRLFRNRQTARSLHFLGLIAMLGFAVVHVALVIIEGFAGNLNYIVRGTRGGDDLTAMLVVGAWLALVVGAQVAATWVSLRHPRGTQRRLRKLVAPVIGPLLHALPSRQAYPEEMISEKFLVNGYPPDTEEWLAFADEGFASWRLRVTGLVERPLELSLAQLRALPAREQTTLHNCIQGWTGVARWKGVPLSEIVKLCRPSAEVQYVIVYSHQWFMGRPFYEVIELDLASDAQTILAYDMNGEPLSRAHGAPLRLRAETLLGYKMVKYVSEIELAPSYELVGQGMGGHREDSRFYGRRAEI